MDPVYDWIFCFYVISFILKIVESNNPIIFRVFCDKENNYADALFELPSINKT